MQHAFTEETPALQIAELVDGDRRELGASTVSAGSYVTTASRSEHDR
jgi:hypothetical protein